MTDKTDFIFPQAYVMIRNDIMRIIESQIIGIATKLKDTDDIASNIVSLINLQKMNVLRKFLKNWHDDKIPRYFWEDKVGEVFGLDIRKILNE
jgi:hypothetical protein